MILLSIGILASCSESIDHPKPEMQVSFEQFIANHLQESSDLPIGYILAEEASKLEENLKVINANNSKNFHSINEVPVSVFRNLDISDPDIIGFIPDIDVLDKRSLEDINSYFPSLSPDDIAQYKVYIGRFYERKMEYAAYSSIRIDDSQDLVQGIFLPDDFYNLCGAELVFYGSHLLRRGAFETAKALTDQYITEMYGTTLLNTQNVRANAAKHAMWNYNIANEVANLHWPLGGHNKGIELAKKATDAHEDCADDLEEKEMDLHNNKVGRDLFDAYPNQSAYHIKRLIRNLDLQGATCVAKDVNAIRASGLVNKLVFFGYHDPTPSEPFRWTPCTPATSPMTVSIIGISTYNHPDFYSWVSNVSGNVGTLTYKWYWNGQLMATGPNMLINVTDDMFPSTGYVDIVLDVRSSTEQKTVKTFRVYKSGTTGPQI